MTITNYIKLFSPLYRRNSLCNNKNSFTLMKHLQTLFYDDIFKHVVTKQTNNLKDINVDS